MARRDFNPRQKTAIEHARGPMLVVAGAGTGKTTVLTERVARLIEKKLARPGEIVALTYTIEAARELRQRVQAKVKDARDLHALNFHSYCFGLLEKHGRNFEVLDDFDLRVFLRQRLHELPLRIFRKAADPGKFLSNLTEFFSRCHDELVSAERYTRYVEDVQAGRAPLPRVSSSKDQDELAPGEIVARCEEIAAVYRKVEAMLAAHNLGTFGMQITGAVRLLRDDARVLDQERAKARFILVDEFQDSNEALLELVKLLAGPEENVFAVGDPDQAIYHFRGASAAAFESFRRAFPRTRHVTLSENYRSLSPILGCAYHVIQKNALVPAAPQLALVREPLQSAREAAARAQGTPLAPAPVALVVHDSGEQEAFHIAAQVEERVRAGEAAWREFCVLYRMASHREELVAELKRREIPFAVEGLDALEATDVRDALAALRALSAPNESAALLRVAAFPEFGIDPARLREQLAAAQRNTPLVALLESTEPGRKVLAAIAEHNRIAPPDTTSALACLEAVLRRFALARDTRSMQTFLEFVRNWQKKPIAGQGTVREFLDYLDLFRGFGGAVPLPIDDEHDAVRLMTAHSAKGREFRHVCVIRAVAQSFPLAYREVLFEFPRELRGEVAGRDSRELHAEEERRLFYVAMTRARDSLTLLAKKDRHGRPYPAGYLRELAEVKEAQPLWTRQSPRAVTLDLAAAAAAHAAVSAIAPWLVLPPRPEMTTMALSASSIEAYETCPLKFKIRYDWKLPEEPTAALQYGNIIHQLLRDYFDQEKAGNPPADEAVLARFRDELAAAAIDDPLQRELYQRDGLQQLTDFLAARRAEAGAFEVLSTERNFKVEIGGILVSGRIDRIDRLAGGQIQIVDYKTGKAKDQKDADKSLQLSIYALAAPLIDPQLTPDHLVLYNMVNNEALVTRRTKDALQKAQDKVREVAAQIRAGRFEPDPGFHCKWCGYKDLCPATEEKIVKLEKLVTAGGVQ